jgi:predicted thioesterase
LENAARNALAPLLEDHESCVGVHVDIEHLAAAPLGEHVVCRARVIQIDGPMINFQVEAVDSSERISRGLHKRAVIDIERFAKRIARKKGRQ